MKSVFLLTGKPGTGKTTVIKKALSRVKNSAGGFYTEEIKSGGTRKGFMIITLDGREAILAHTDLPGSHNLGKYHINTENLEKVAVNAVLTAIRQDDIIVIDEIGKMELLSPLFRNTVIQAMKSGKRVLGTIMFKPDPFADSIKKNPDVEVMTLTAANRDKVLIDIIARLEQ